MIGVIATPAEREVVKEFFELFKTPWEFYQSDRYYDVVLYAGEDDLDGCEARLILVYAGSRTVIDKVNGIDIASQECNRGLLYKEDCLPIFGNRVTFYAGMQDLLRDEQTGQPVAYKHESAYGTIVRIGYDLFDEINTLLITGQDVRYAETPTLELHIELLRNLIVSQGIQLIEIPPVPEGHSFIACLTHDVDHPMIRRHKLDHTILGFVYRGVWGSLLNFFQARTSFRKLLRNWAAVTRLPLVYLGLAKDFWSDFHKRYAEIEKGLPSTFFIIPFADEPGSSDKTQTPENQSSEYRAAIYGVGDIAVTIQEIIANGGEVGLHGLDAWCNVSRGHAELDEIRRFAGTPDIGVRIHWLYYDQQSAAVLEQAGAAYDSTIGYREAVGFLAGTTQVFKPAAATCLLELPLHAMDTALFYQPYLGVSPEEGIAILRRLTDKVARFGGCFTVNWHDRSLSPERLWDDCYRDLIEDLRGRNPWFATAGQAVAWFRKRRAAVFKTGDMGGSVHLESFSACDDGLPGLQLRIHNAPNSEGISVHESFAISCAAEMTSVTD